MAISVSQMSEQDIPACADIYIEAFKNDAFSRAAFPRESTPKLAEWWRTADLDDFRSQTTARYLKAVEGDKIVGFATWHVPAVDANGELKRGGDDPDALPEYPEGSDKALLTKFLGTLAKRRAEIMGNRPHCYLEIVATLPAWQGRGAASKMIQWGIQVADKMELEAYLEGNEENLPLYRKFGFKAVSQYRLEELDYLESFMVRPARKKDT